MCSAETRGLRRCWLWSEDEPGDDAEVVDIDTGIIVSCHVGSGFDAQLEFGEEEIRIAF